MADWFSASLAQPPRHVWGPGGAHSLLWEGAGPIRRTVCLVHGGTAHAWWWAPLISLWLRADWRIVAIDLAGHGDGPRRERYTVQDWADDLVAECQAQVVVGHSLGGRVALEAALRHPGFAEHLILADVPIRPPTDWRPYWRPTPVYRHRVYADEAIARQAFRLMPAQVCKAERYLDFIVHHSLQPAGEGLVWKFDSRLVSEGPGGFGPVDLERVQIATDVVFGATSALMTPDIRQSMAARLPEDSVFSAVQGAGHHVFLDEPEAFCRAVCGLVDRRYPRGVNPPP